MYSKVASFYTQMLACYFVLHFCHDLAFFTGFSRSVSGSYGGIWSGFYRGH